MKKSISVNIKGRIFNIEEDAFEVLKKYLDSIKSYFSSYEGADEIFGDIESRIAEILHEKLSKTKEVITSEDVDAVIAMMGKVEDFVEQEEEYVQPETESAESEHQHTHTEGKKRLYKDGKRKIISGVCAGMAHYFSIDPFWIRLVFVLVFFLSGFLPALIGYGILAIVLPKRNDLKEIQVKKLFRDRDDAVIGGVSSGIAKYFGSDPVWVRLLFVLCAFAGFGLITYIVIWVITPEAKTRAEKMQMEGEPVTISNIEKNVKDNLNLKDKNGEESVLATILLFPFRLVAQILNIFVGMAKPFSIFILQILRFAGGFGLSILGLSLMFVFFIFLAVGIGLISGDYIVLPNEIPISMFSTLVPGYGLIASFFTGFFPALLLILAGISLLLQRSIIKPIVIGAIFGCWVVSLGVLAASGAYIAKNFREESYINKEEIIAVQGDELILELNENGEDLGQATLLIKTTTDSNYRLVQAREARGANISEAQKNAEGIIYQYQLAGNRLILNESITFDDSAVFSKQEIGLTLYVPEGKKVRLQREILDILRTRRFLSSPELTYSNFKSFVDLKDRIWLSERGQFKCINCDDMDDNEQSHHRNDRKYDDAPTNTTPYDLRDFSKIKISHAFDVHIKQADEFKVSVVASDDDLEEVQLSVRRGWLIIDYERFGNNINILDMTDDSRDVKIYIEAPAIDELDISGATLVDVILNHQPNLVIDLSGASKLDISGSMDNCTIDISGASEAELSGKCRVMNADVSGASELDSRDMMCDIVVVEASGASTAKVHATEKLDAEASGAATIKYKGNPKITSDEDGFADIQRD